MDRFWAGFEKRAGLLRAAVRAIPGTGVVGKAFGALGVAGSAAELAGAARNGGVAGTTTKNMYRNLARSARPQQTF